MIQAIHQPSKTITANLVNAEFLQHCIENVKNIIVELGGTESLQVTPPGEFLRTTLTLGNGRMVHISHIQYAQETVAVVYEHVGDFGINSASVTRHYQPAHWLDMVENPIHATKCTRCNIEHLELEIRDFLVYNKLPN